MSLSKLIDTRDQNKIFNISIKNDLNNEDKITNLVINRDYLYRFNTNLNH